MPRSDQPDEAGTAVPQFGQNLLSKPSGAAQFPQAIGRNEKPHCMQKRAPAAFGVLHRMQATVAALERAAGTVVGWPQPECRLPCESWP